MHILATTRDLFRHHVHDRHVELHSKYFSNDRVVLLHVELNAKVEINRGM